MYPLSDSAVPEPLRAGLRGVGQVFFQENAWTGACFLLGLLLSRPPMAVGAIVGLGLTSGLKNEATPSSY